MSDKKTNESQKTSDIASEPHLLAREEKTETKKKQPLIRIILILLVPVLFVRFIAQERADIYEGTLKASHFVRLTSPAAGILKVISGKRGDAAIEREALAKIENVDFKRSAEEANLRLETLSHDLISLTGQESLLEKDSARKLILFENGAIGKADFERAQHGLNEIKQVKSLKEKEVSFAHDDLELANSKVQSLTVKMPFLGILLSSPDEKLGTFLKEGELLFEVADPESFYVEVQVEEKEITKIAVGDPALIYFKSAGGQSFGGEVASIHPSFQEQVEKVFKVKNMIVCEIKLFSLPKDARYGMKAEVRIKVRRLAYSTPEMGKAVQEKDRLQKAGDSLNAVLQAAEELKKREVKQ